MTGLQQGLAALGVAAIFAAGWTGSSVLQAFSDKPPGYGGAGVEPGYGGAGVEDVTLSGDTPGASDATQIPANPQIDYDGFVELAVSERGERAKRRVPLEKFLEMAAEPNTIILDTRSKAAFEAAHLKGAIHLNFSDFTAPKLAKVIPDKNTRVLIYCNNNFRNDDGDDTAATERLRVTAKSYELALNIPTFINLRGYGYRNVYELADAIAVNDSRVTFEGSAVEKEVPQAVSQRVSR